MKPGEKGIVYLAVEVVMQPPLKNFGPHAPYLCANPKCGRALRLGEEYGVDQDGKMYCRVCISPPAGG
jgi:hypothetical protein